MENDNDLLVKKLKLIRKNISNIQPMGYGWVEYNESLAPFEDDINANDIQNEIDKLIFLLHRFDLVKELSSLDKIIDDSKDKFLRIIDGYPPNDGEYEVVVRISELIDNILFVYSNEEIPELNLNSKYIELLNILNNLEKTFTITRKYPSNEKELHKLIESILICSFKIKTKPIVPQIIKNFIPDTGVLETKTLLEYKYITSIEEVPIKVDELFSDSVGYKDKNWNNLICVIYETERFTPIDSWRDELKKINNCNVVLVKGIPNKK